MFQSSPINIADSCNALLSGYWSFWSAWPAFILGTADFTKKTFHIVCETENSVMPQHHVLCSSDFCFTSSVLTQKLSIPDYRWRFFQFILLLITSNVIRHTGNHFQYLWSKEVRSVRNSRQAAVCRQYVITVIMNVILKTTFILPDETFSAMYVRDSRNGSWYQRSSQREINQPKNE